MFLTRRYYNKIFTSSQTKLQYFSKCFFAKRNTVKNQWLQTFYFNLNMCIMLKKHFDFKQNFDKIKKNKKFNVRRFAIGEFVEKFKLKIDDKRGGICF